ncbi:hypothetical protein GCM10027605_20770 [Micromonospora zhanjiangensis]
MVVQMVRTAYEPAGRSAAGSDNEALAGTGENAPDLDAIDERGSRPIWSART